jgi:uncharacterized protein (DUF2062 family)
MSKKMLQRFIPSQEKIQNTKGLRFLSKWIMKPELWHLHRTPVSKAFAIGLFWMSIPIPSQMVAASITAIFFRANLPLSIVLVWISNPLTMPPIFYFNYLVGTWVLGEKTVDSLGFEMSWEWLLNTLGDLWQPLFLGSAVVGLVLGLIGYITVLILWRLQIILKWRNRQKARKELRSND